MRFYGFAADEIVAGGARRHARPRHRSEARLGVAQSRPLSGRRQPRRPRDAAARAGARREERRPHPREPPPSHAAARRHRPARRVADEGAAVHRHGTITGRCGSPTATILRALVAPPPARSSSCSADADAHGAALRRCRTTSCCVPRRGARAARRGRAAGNGCSWSRRAEDALFDASDLPTGRAASPCPRRSSTLADDVICHSDPERLAAALRAALAGDAWRARRFSPTRPIR